MTNTNKITVRKIALHRMTYDTENKDSLIM